jgi:major intracellular serine protease
MDKTIKIPKFRVEKVVTALSESVDWGLIQHKIPDLWSQTQGEDITVYILDTGDSCNHIDLENNFVNGRNFTRSASGDKCGHGTACAGVICAEKNNIGVIGVAPKAKFVMIKVLDDTGSGEERFIASGLKFVYECAKGYHIGFPYPDVISLSLGSESPLSGAEKWMKELYALNIPIICAAGNSGKEGVNYPARYKEAIAIGAYDEKGNLARFSTTGNEVAFTGPGVNIYTTWPNSEYVKISGTSFSCPFVAGIVALMLAKHKKQELETGRNDCKTIEQIKWHLMKHSIDKGDLGRDSKWGYGMIDVEALINSEHFDTQDIIQQEVTKTQKNNLLRKLKNFITSWF